MENNIEKASMKMLCPLCKLSLYDMARLFVPYFHLKELSLLCLPVQVSGVCILIIYMMRDNYAKIIKA